MRPTALLFTAMLLASPAAAQTGPTSPPAATASSTPGGRDGSSFDLPVSLDRIRAALDRPASARLLRRLQDTPTFRVQILEQRKIDELLATLDFKSGPSPAGGTYGYEQQRVLFPPVDNPSIQPLGAFSQGQLLTILAENVIGKYVAGHTSEALAKAVRGRTQESARREIDDAIAEYCAGKPNGGAGIELCDRTPAAR